MDEAFQVGKVITVDRSTSSKKVQVNLGTTPYAMGQVDETYVLVHTGFIKFPDESNKNYPFWYYPVEGILKWSQEKGKGWADDIWTAESDERSKNTYFSRLSRLLKRLTNHIIINVSHKMLGISPNLSENDNGFNNFK